MASSISSNRLRELEARVRRELELLDHPKTNWVPPRKDPSGRPVLDIAVVGGGQAGLAILFALTRENVTSVTAFDRNRRGREGPWTTFARMRQLRTNKDITGPALGYPSLTPRAWFTAKHGEAAWDALERIPRTEWQAYLDWYRDVLDLPVENESEVGALTPDRSDDPQSLIRVPVQTREGSRTVLAREVVLANGIEGCGVWDVPSIIRDNLPPDRYRQANTDIDMSMFRGKRLIVVGANASAFDAAAVALENGADRVELLARRRKIPTVNAHRPLDNNGWHQHFADLDPATRWRLAVHVMRNNQPPPQDSFDLAHSLPGFAMHEGAEIASAGLRSGDIVLTTIDGRMFEGDFLIAATGFVCDLARRPETSALAEHAALWRDRYDPPEAEAWPPMGSYPWFDRNFAFTEREPGTAPWLRHVHCFSLGTLPSLGMTGGSASSIRHGVPRLVRAVTRQLFLDDAGHHVDALLSFGDEDLARRD